MTLRISDLQSDSNLDSIRNSCYVLCHSFSFAAFFVVVPENRIIRVQLVEAKLLWLKRYKYTLCFSNLSHQINLSEPIQKILLSLSKNLIFQISIRNCFVSQQIKSTQSAFIIVTSQQTEIEQNFSLLLRKLNWCNWTVKITFSSWFPMFPNCPQGVNNDL